MHILLGKGRTRRERGKEAQGRSGRGWKWGSVIVEWLVFRLHCLFLSPFLSTFSRSPSLSFLFLFPLYAHTRYFQPLTHSSTIIWHRITHHQVSVFQAITPPFAEAGLYIYLCICWHSSLCFLCRTQHTINKRNQSYEYKHQDNEDYITMAAPILTNPFESTSTSTTTSSTSTSTPAFDALSPGSQPPQTQTQTQTQNATQNLTQNSSSTTTQSPSPNNQNTPSISTSNSDNRRNSQGETLPSPTASWKPSFTRVQSWNREDRKREIMLEREICGSEGVGGGFSEKWCVEGEGGGMGLLECIILSRRGWALI